MTIKLIKVWQGHKPGSTLDLSDGMANLLVRRLRVAEPYEPVKPTKPKRSNKHD